MPCYRLLPVKYLSEPFGQVPLPQLFRVFFSLAFMSWLVRVYYYLLLAENNPGQLGLAEGRQLFI